MEWFEHLDGNVIVSDRNNIVIYMNKKALASYEHEGGADLIGKNLMECHNPRSQEIIRHILDTGENNVYTIEKKGKKKIIYQTPWKVDGIIQGIVELSLEIPFDMPHYIRG
jgi:transcriptional regulator with PAS, ATPase and Fis domain